jgi:hypothetical protein
LQSTYLDNNSSFTELQTMTDLSPAAQAVANAVNHYETNHWLTPNQVAAAALRAISTQVTPLSTNLRQNKIRYELLAIADELEVQ